MNQEKPISMALILLGVAFSTLALSQLNQMSVSNAQSEIARPVAEAQIIASESLAESYGQTAEEIAKTSQEARALLDKSISTMNNSYLMTGLIDGILGLVLLFAGIVTTPRSIDFPFSRIGGIQ